MPQPPLRCVIRQILDAVRCSGGVLFVFREQRVESLPYVILLLLADQPVAISIG